MRGIVSAALFMIWLILTIPFFSATVYAEMNLVKVHGMDDIEGYRGRDDFTSIEFNTSSERVINAEDQTKNPVCTEVAGSVPLTYSCLFFEQSVLPMGQEAYDFSIIDVNGNPVEHLGVSINVDDMAPEIEDFGYEGGPMSAELLNFTYAVVDHSHDDDGSVCSGLRRVEVRERGTLTPLAGVDIGSYAPNCTYSGRITVENPVPQGSVDDVELCLVAYDQITSGMPLSTHASQSCIPFYIDREAPGVTCDIAYLNNRPIEYVSTTGPLSFIDHAEVRFTVSEGKVARVSGDLSRLNYNAHINVNYRDITWSGANTDHITCINITGGLECRFTDITLDLLDGEADYDVTVVDSGGYQSQVTCPLTFEVDNSVPTVLYVGTRKTDGDGRSFIKPGANTFYADIDDSGVGFEDRKVFLDLSRLNSAYVQPMRMPVCEEGDGMWTCVGLANVTASLTSGTTIPVTVVYPSSDDVGNLVQGYTDVHVFDSVAPAFLPGELSLSTSCVVSGETLGVRFNVTERASGMDRVVADASEISTSYDPFEGSCEDLGDGVWECYVEIGAIRSIAGTKKLGIALYDIAGNVGHFSPDVDVCMPDPNTVPNVVDFDVLGVMPPSIDRTLASNTDGVPSKHFIRLSFAPQSGSDIMAFDEPDCSAISPYLDPNDRPYLLHIPPGEGEEGSTLLSLSLLLNDDEVLAQDSFVVNCTLSMRVRSGFRVYLRSEVEEISIPIPLTDWPLGGVDVKVRKNINDHKAKLRDLDKSIETWDDINGVLKFICTTADYLVKANAMLQMIKTAIWVVVAAICLILELVSWTGVSKIVDFLVTTLWGRAACYGGDASHGFVNKYVWTPGFFNNWGKLGMWIKTLCMIYSCRLCHISNFVEVTSSVFSSDDTQVTASAGDLTGGQWQSAPVETKVDSWSDGLVYDWDPYKSIHVPPLCLCLPGGLYNLRKERQVECVYVKCLQNAVSMGLPSTVCDEAYDQQTCLYVDGAAWRAMGKGPKGVAVIFQGLLDFIIASLPVSIAAIPYQAVCGGGTGDQYIFGSSNENWQEVCEASSSGSCEFFWIFSWYSPLCGIWGVILQIMENEDILTNGYDFSVYEGQLESYDQCEGVDYSG